jgi:hypothetical protein
MNPPGNHGQSFKVNLSGVVAERLRQIQRQATLQGRGEETIFAFRQIVDRLMKAPFDLGEPLYRLPSLRLQIRSAAVGPLGVFFGVSEDKPLVFIKGFRLLGKRII